MYVFFQIPTNQFSLRTSTSQLTTQAATLANTFSPPVAKCSKIHRHQAHYPPHLARPRAFPGYRRQRLEEPLKYVMHWQTSRTQWTFHTDTFLFLFEMFLER